MITILDYGMGNIGSIVNMLKRIGTKSIVTSDFKSLKNADKIILPGVGAYDTAIKRIDGMHMRDIIIELVVHRKVPLLGICLGMQLIVDGSEEGLLSGLGIIKGQAFHFKNHITNNFKIPHMGWNDVQINNQGPLSKGFNDEIRFYFVHSYFVKVNNDDNSMMKCNYGLIFDAAIQQENVFGVQFHPEKSHKFGMQILRNFVDYA